MAGGLENRPSRSVQEAKAFRAIQVGSVSGAAFILTTVFALAGAIGATLPILFLLLTILCVARFASVTGVVKRRS